MSNRCPKCGQALPEMDLPVCAHCGARLPTELAATATIDAGPALPLFGGESRDEVLQRFFEPAVTYQVPTVSFWTQSVAPLLLPIAALAGGASQAHSEVQWLTPVLTILAGALMVHIWLTRAPSRTAVTLSTRGLRCAGTYRGWDGLQSVRAVAGRAKSAEPAALELRLDDGQVLRIPQELTRTAPIQSLRNLQAILEAVTNTVPEVREP